MKKLIPLVMLLTLSLSVSAQDPAYSGPAKTALKSFWTHFLKLRNGTGTPNTLTNAERMLQQVKEKDPSYNVTALETELKQFKEKALQEEKDQYNAKGKEDETIQYFRGVWQQLLGVYSSSDNIEPGATGKTYYDRMAAINIAEYKEKKNQSGSAAGSLIKNIDEILTDYDGYVTRAERMRWNVDELLNRARNQSDPQEKMRLLEEARYECEAVLLLSPENSAFRKKLEDVKKLLGNADNEAAKYFTSDFHKKNLNQVIWSSAPLLIGKELGSAGQIKTEFKSGDAIFGTVYLGNYLKDLMKGNEKLRIVIKVDEGTAIWGGDLSYLIVPQTVQDKSYFQFALLPDKNWMNVNYAPYLAKENWTYSYFLDELVRAGDISHKISVQLYFPGTSPGTIRSELTLDLGNGIAALKEQANRLHDQLMASRQLPKAAMNNPALEQQMLQAANSLGWKEKFKRVIITSAAWTIKKNELTGAILYRYIPAVATCTDSEGKCYYQEFSFRQEYSGAGKYESNVKYNSYGSKREIGCDKIK